MNIVTNTILLTGEPTAIFDFVTTAKYWPQWHPATVGVSGQIDKPMQRGDVIRERAKIGQDIGESDWTVTVWERNRRVALEMPGTRLGDLRITYRFEPREEGVQFTRTLEFDASRLPEPVAENIEKQMDSDSAIALLRIKEMVDQKSRPDQD